MPKGLAAAPKDSALRMDGSRHPRSRRHIPVPSVRASPLLKLPRCAPLVHASAPATSHYLRSWSETWFRASPSRVHEETSFAGRTGSFEKLHVQNGPSSPSKKFQPSPGVQSRYFSWIPLHCWTVSGADFWVAIVVVVEVVSESQRVSSLLSVCTAAEEDATCCRSPEPRGTTGLAADSVFAAALLGSARTGLPSSCFALLLLPASVVAEWERLVPAVSCLLFQHCLRLCWSFLTGVHPPWILQCTAESLSCRRRVL